MTTLSRQPAPLPKMFRIKQRFPASAQLDLGTAVQAELDKLRPQLKRGMRIAVGTGSRGITDIGRIISMVVEGLKARGASPFVIPAMGSHGGATSQGQVSLLGEYGITQTAIGAPIRGGMDVQPIGTLTGGAEVVLSKEALAADGILVVNRVKPHTNFRGSIGSGLLKMLVVGLGKHQGAANFHLAAARMGYEPTLLEASRMICQSAPILGGIALVEDQKHQTVGVDWVPSSALPGKEKELFQHSRTLMPRIPFDTIDLLIIDRIGKNISGSGMDPNVTGRMINGDATLRGQPRPKPLVDRILVRDLTPESHGNAIGIGFADVTTTRLVEAMDREVTSVNALTSLSVGGAKVPIHFPTDQLAITRALGSLPLESGQSARVVRIRDTLNLEQLESSEVLWNEVQANENLEAQEPPRPMSFDPDGNLTDPL